MREVSRRFGRMWKAFVCLRAWDACVARAELLKPYTNYMQGVRWEWMGARGGGVEVEACGEGEWGGEEIAGWDRKLRFG